MRALTHEVKLKVVDRLARDGLRSLGVGNLGHGGRLADVDVVIVLAHRRLASLCAAASAASGIRGSFPIPAMNRSF